MQRDFIYEVVKMNHDRTLTSHGKFDDLDAAMEQLKEISKKNKDKKSYSIRRTEVEDTED